jgi:cystathionine beta-lyase/cystathionine gamma-synthase
MKSSLKVAAFLLQYPRIRPVHHRRLLKNGNPQQEIYDRQGLGISDALIRLPAGVGNPGDVSNDLKQVLSDGGGTDQRRS